MTDIISRQAAIRWVKTECNPYGKPTLDFESGKKVIEYLKHAPSAQQWIPCSERLPEEGIVLVTYRDRDIDILRYPTAYRKYDIIAWMPIEPWRGEEDETD